MLRRSKTVEGLERQLTLFADYFQLHIADDGGGGDLSAAWTDEASARGLAVATGIVGVSTARNVDVPVLLRVLDQEPQADDAEWDRVVEASLVCDSGRLVVMGCTDDFAEALRVPVPRGPYRLRASSRGLASVMEHWLDADDVYRIEIWPAPTAEVRVIK